MRGSSVLFLKNIDGTMIDFRNSRLILVILYVQELMRTFLRTIGDNFSIVITLVPGIVVAVLYPVGIIPQAAIVTIIIGLLTLLSVAEVIERRKASKRVELLIVRKFHSLVSRGTVIIK